MENSLAIGIDVGATKIAAALIAQDGELLASHQIPTAPERGVDAVLQDMAAEIDTLAQIAHQTGRPLNGVGIGTPGQVNSEAGWVHNAVNLGWREVHLVDEMQARTAARLPVWVQKDANASTLGEYYLGAGRGSRDIVYLGVGSGLGGGILAGGRLITGANWNAAEVGHISLDPENGRLCACGLRGCAETVTSGPGLLAVARQYLQEKRFPSSLQLSDQLSTADIVRAHKQGDPLASAAVAQVGSWLGIVAASCLMLLNPGRIIIGGGLGLAIFEALKTGVQAEVQKRVLTASYQDLQILPSQVSSSAAGPACLVWYGLGQASGERAQSPKG